MADEPKRMPDYVFGRRRDIELQSGMMLVGFVVTKFRKSTVPSEEDRKRVAVVVERMVMELRAGRMTEDATISMWEGGVRPANGIEVPIPYEVMERWMASQAIFAIRVASNGTGDITLVHDDAQMRGQFPWRLVMPV